MSDRDGPAGHDQDDHDPGAGPGEVPNTSAEGGHEEGPSKKPGGARGDRPDVEPDEKRAEGAEKKERSAGRYAVKVRFGTLPVTGTATATDPEISKGAAVVLRTSRGTELGLALSRPEAVDDGLGETIGHVLRTASARDLERQQRIEDEIEAEELKYCRRKIDERGLKMRLSGVEHIMGGERIIFYFTAERRVDFRALVRDLAWHFHTRIELRQIGARDEARLLADFEHCGRPLCCKTFLGSLEPVTMRMAKLQRTTLDPSKISGRCGRLMCCLRFEDQVYRDLRRGLPKRGTRVAVGSSEGEVLSTEILQQKVTVRLSDGTVVEVPVSELRPPEGERPGHAGSEAPARAAEARPPRRMGGPAPARGDKATARRPARRRPAPEGEPKKETEEAEREPEREAAKSGAKSASAGDASRRRGRKRGARSSGRQRPRHGGRTGGRKSEAGPEGGASE